MAKIKEWRPFRYFNVNIVRVIDGDTVEADIDVGFRTTIRNKFRLLGVNTPERRIVVMEAYDAATAYTQQWCDDHTGAIEIETMKHDSFGRWLAMFRCQITGEYLNEMLIKEGHSPDDYRGGLDPYMRSTAMLVENINVPGIKEARRLEEIGYLKNRTKRKP